MSLQPQKFAPYRIARLWNFATFDVLLPRPAEYNGTSFFFLRYWMHSRSRGHEYDTVSLYVPQRD